MQKENRIYSRTDNAVRNIGFGFINRLVSIFIPFLLRTLIIYVLGEEYVGLNGLFSSVLQVLNVAELGIGSAIAASLYQPIEERNAKAISALLLLYRRIYSVIGIIILVTAGLIMPFLPRLIKGTPPSDVNIYLLFALYVLETVSSYFCLSYKVVLISAHQRSDITEKVGTSVKCITAVMQAFAIFVYKNITLYVLINVICVASYYLICGCIATTMWRDYKCEGVLDQSIAKRIKQSIKALAIQKIGNTISVSLDTIIISAVLGLVAVAQYGNYIYVSSSVGAFLTLVFASITAGIGNSIVKETVEKNYNDFMKFSFMNCWLVGWCAICLICLYQNFIYLWIGPDALFDDFTVLMIVFCFYVQYIRKLVITYKDAAGMWNADRYKPLVGGLVNLLFNIILIKMVGLIGVVISTIISFLFVELPWETNVLFRDYFKRSQHDYYMLLGKMLCKILLAGLITYVVCSLLGNQIYSFILKMLICVVLPNALLVAMNVKSKEFRQMENFVKGILKKV